MAHTKIVRRDLLKSAALTALLGPIVRSTMAEAAVPEPRRLLVLFTPNGLNYKDAGPNGTETNFSLGEYYAAMEKHKADLVALSGMQIGGVSFGENSEYGHRSGGMGCLTCTPDEKTGRPTGPSIDQLIAQKIKEQGKAPMLKAPIFSVGSSGVSDYAHSFCESAGKAVPLVDDPKKAFDALFHDFLASTGQDPVKLFAKKKSILDAAWDDCKSYLPALPKEGQDLLGYHCDRIRELEANLQSGVAASCTPPQAALGQVSALDPNDPKNYPALTDFFWQLIEVTFLCDISRVSSFSFGNAANRLNMPWLDIPVLDKVDTGETQVKDHHSHTHAGTRQTVGQFMNWYATKVSQLVDRLKAPGPGGKKLLDSTVIHWTTEYGAGGPHTNDNVPMFVIGGGSGTFRTGRHLAFANDPKNSHALMVSLIKYMQIDGVEQFGHPAGGSGPLAQLMA